MKLRARTQVEASDTRLSDATDNELFEAIAKGALGPLGELFDRHHASVRAFAERMVVTKADADDLVQETFLVASRAASSFEPGESAKPFLLGVAAQLARRRRRSFARLRSMLESFAKAPAAAPPSTPEDALASGQEVALVHAAIAQLSDDHREVLLMVDLSGLSGVDAAKAIGVPAGTVWRRLHEARAELRANIQRRKR